MSSGSPEAAELRRQLADYLGWLASSGQVQYLPCIPTLQANPSERSSDGLSERSSGGVQMTPAPKPEAQPRVAPPAAKAEPPEKTVETAPAAAAPGPKNPLRAQARSWSSAQKLDYLQHKVLGDCQRCPLAKGRQHLVFGEGDPNARMMIIGEAPGAQEDRAGRPFVGAAGQRLDRWIQAGGDARKDLYIANVLKCRPPGNRDPAPAEIEACRGFLQAQIRAIAPQVIVALGRFAGALVLGRPGLRLYQMRGKPHAYRDPKLPGCEIPVVVTYHPSYVLRREQELQPGQRASQEESTVLEDFARARAAMTATAPKH